MNANIIFDLILLLILFLGVLTGARRGFIKTVAAPLKFMIALTLSIIFSPMLSEIAVKPIVTAIVYDSIGGILNGNAAYIEPVLNMIIYAFAFLISFIIILLSARFLIGLSVSFSGAVSTTGVLCAVNKISGCVLTFAVSFLLASGLVFVSDFLVNAPAVCSILQIDCFTGGPIYDFIKTISPLEFLLN